MRTTEDGTARDRPSRHRLFPPPQQGLRISSLRGPRFRWMDGWIYSIKKSSRLGKEEQTHTDEQRRSFVVNLLSY